MREQRSREEASEDTAQPQPPDDVRTQQRPRPQDEFKSYSLELLAILED